MDTRNYKVIKAEGGAPIKAWVEGVPLDTSAEEQLKRVASLPFIHKWVAAMPDVHWGKGATVGSVIATHNAIIPAAVGVDLGCGMMAVQTSLSANDLPDTLKALRSVIESKVPHGRTDNGGRNDRGSWHTPPEMVQKTWNEMQEGYQTIVDKYPRIKRGPDIRHLGTLGTGNHFIEICLDQENQVWIMLHSGSRGLGNRIGSYFIEAAKKEMRRWFINLPDVDLAYLPEGSELFDDYIKAVSFAQNYAFLNRQLMMQRVLEALRGLSCLPAFDAELTAVNCHHNYVAREHHYGKNVWVTRKGAVRAREGDLGIIPGSMGAKSYIVQGKGNKESFCSSSHGAGRAMSRTAARKLFSVSDHLKATEGVECRKDQDVIDETPGAYKDIDAVMEAQRDLVEVKYTLKQVVCVKG